MSNWCITGANHPSSNLSSEGVETTPLILESKIPTQLMNYLHADDTAQYYVASNICVDVIEMTRLHVLALLLAESAKAARKHCCMLFLSPNLCNPNHKFKV
jgi:hypothetical protein